MRSLSFGLLLWLALCVEASPSDLNAIAASQTWRALLHYDAGGILGTRSAVIDSDFFIHADGARDPLAELKATVAGLRESDRVGRSVQCLFPARARFLEHKLNERFPEVPCPDLEAWRDRHAGGTVGLTFVNGYLGNPASFFGHLLLHVRVEDSESLADPTSDDLGRASRLLDTSINFGADVPEGEGLVRYMAKGLFGGYNAQYSEANFYQNSSLYSEREMRDLWIYDLDLSRYEYKLLIDHLYEVMHRDYQYLFLSQNCASRIARTLSLVSPELETPGSNALWTTPESVVVGATRARSESGASLVGDAHYVPSRGAITDYAWAQLSQRLRQAATDYWPEPATLLEFDQLAGLTEAEQAKLLDVLLSHELWLAAAGDAVETGHVRSTLLRKRARLPVSQGLEIPPDPPLVHKATPPQMIQLGGDHNSVNGSSITLAGRLLQYDSLDAASPRLTGGSMEFGAFEAELSGGDLALREATVVAVSALDSYRSGLPGTRTQAPWYGAIDIKRSDLARRHSHDARATLLAGVSSTRSRWLSYGLLGPQLATTRNQKGALALGARAGVLGDWTSNQRSHFLITHREAFRGSDGQRTRMRFAHRFAISQNRDIRLEFISDPASGDYRSSIRLGFYFP